MVMERGVENAFAADLGDGADLVLVDKEVGVAFAGETEHGVVEVLDPAADGLAVAELDLNDDLAVAEGAQVEGFLAGVAGRGRLGAAARG
jgi:hypothetical protein